MGARVKVSAEEGVKTITIQTPTVAQIREIEELYRAQQWWQAADDDSPKLIPRLIAGSHCFVAAIEGEEIVGMGRVISDGVSDAYIQDLMVRHDRRHRGIGRRILETLLKRLRDDGIRWVGLIAQRGSYDLYRQAGFAEMPDALPMLMNRVP
ncbi:MAG: GNAT family N-acetyltransferase [Deltaproteobacteria bacterium]|nr:GNAT family N-acetyltransferase [Deltaproteobacteria bacterium]